ncbi:hypothetical protein V3C99_016490 [Haemonchus contortus]
MLGLTEVKLRLLVQLSRRPRPTFTRALHEYEQRHEGRSSETAESSVGSFRASERGHQPSG